MVARLDSVLVIFAIIGFLSYWTWRLLDWVWLRPKKLERQLRQQGLNGNSYRLLYGDSKDIIKMAKEARSKPINLSDDIIPRVLPFYHVSIQKYGKISFSWIGPMPRVTILDPKMINEILLKNNVFKKPKRNPITKMLVTGLASYEDEKWAKHRKIINPAFYVEKLKDMLPAMYVSCCETMSKWETLISEKGSSSCELDVWPCLQNLACDVISRTAFGSSYEEGSRIFKLQKEQCELALQVWQSLYIPGWRFVPTKRTKRMNEIYFEVQSLVKKIVTKREKAAKELAEACDDDLLGMLLKSCEKEVKEHGNNKSAGMSIEDVVEECKLFYFAGQETTAVLLVWTMILLSMHPNWQDQAREEVLQVFGNGKPDHDGLHRLKIVTMILNEVLRLYPPVAWFTRMTHEETKVGKMTLPPGVELMLPIILVHRDREIWGEDVKEFHPERFFEGVAKATNNQVSFFPFSWGPRICIGINFAMLEAKMALSMILQRFSFELSPSYSHAPLSIATLKPLNGAHLILHKI